MCMFISVFVTGGTAYEIYPNQQFSVVLAKFICSCALHLMLYPFVERSMSHMRYVNNHPKKFTHPNVAFAIAFSSFIINILAELINVYLLTYQHNVEHCIIHFVALEVIVEIPHILVGSLGASKLKSRIFANTHSLKVTNRGRDITFKSRSCCNKISRVLYRFNRCIFVSFIFYGQPFYVMLIYFNYLEGGEVAQHH
jgi:hypothetical protein